MAEGFTVAPQLTCSVIVSQCLLLKGFIEEILEATEQYNTHMYMNIRMNAITGSTVCKLDVKKAKHLVLY